MRVSKQEFLISKEANLASLHDKNLLRISLTISKKPVGVPASPE